MEFETYDDLKRAVAQLDGTEFRGCNVTCVAEVNRGESWSGRRANDVRILPTQLLVEVLKVVPAVITMDIPPLVDARCLPTATVVVEVTDGAILLREDPGTTRPLVGMEVVVAATTRHLENTANVPRCVADVIHTIRGGAATAHLAVRCPLTTTLPVEVRLMEMDVKTIPRTDAIKMMGTGMAT